MNTWVDKYRRNATFCSHKNNRLEPATIDEVKQKILCEDTQTFLGYPSEPEEEVKEEIQTEITSESNNRVKSGLFFDETKSPLHQVFPSRARE